MKVINSKLHGVLDYLTVIFLAAAPTLFQMEGFLCTFTYALAGVHLLLTILTSFELGLVKVIPFRIHGVIEFFVAILLAGVAFWFNHEGNNTGYYLYITLAAIIAVVFFLTDFRTGRRA